MEEYEFPDEEEDADEAATVPCPECGAEVYDDTDICPRCGNYILSELTTELTWWPWRIVALGILGGLAFGAVMQILQ